MNFMMMKATYFKPLAITWYLPAWDLIVKCHTTRVQSVFPLYLPM